jgi:hypothetical protein
MRKNPVQQGRLSRPSFVKRHSLLTRSPRDTLHEERFTNDENAAAIFLEYWRWQIVKIEPTAPQRDAHPYQ